jgi:adenosylcobyric acid synthase
MKDEADLVLIEGAGSAAEINLRAGDIANMGFAEAAGCPVALVGDIDRGGIFAQILGTKAALAPEDSARIKGFLVNKFRGDQSLFADGMTLLAQRTGWRALGLAPFFPAAARLPAEDAMALAHFQPSSGSGVTIVAPMLPWIANFDDLDPLRLEPNVRLVFARPGEPLPLCDLIILPGSKATIADLAALRNEGWDIDISAHVRRGGKVLGLCGGYQMLGRAIADPRGMEGPPARVAGLGLLDVETVLTGDKRLAAVEGICLANGAPFSGYEMHIGETRGPDCARPLLRFSDGRLDGAIAPNGRALGGYAHGLFAGDAQRKAWLAWLGQNSDLAYDATIEQTLDDLAAHLSEHCDLDAMLAIAR